jgi:uncharacterized protein YjlB
MHAPRTFHFADDGLVPNNPLPFLLYPAAIAAGADAAERLKALFAANGWGQDLWQNGIFDYLHYHATVHEVLGIAAGWARVQFGGDGGDELRVTAGDVAVLPAGTGHRCIEASADFSVVGGYPPGATMQITRPSPRHRAEALTTIPRVSMPESDPVHGRKGPLLTLWSRA